MEKSNFKKLVWAQILFIPLSVFVSVTAPKKTDYSEFEDSMYSGFLSTLGDTAFYSATILFFSLLIVSWALLLRFQKSGPLFYTLTMIFGIFLTMLTGDEISYGLYYPLEWMQSVIQGVILYLVLFTPLKAEFGKPKAITQNS